MTSVLNRKPHETGDLGISNGLNEFFMLAFDPGILVIVNFNVERVEIDGVTDTRTRITTIAPVSISGKRVLIKPVNPLSFSCKVPS